MESEKGNTPNASQGGLVTPPTLLQRPGLLEKAIADHGAIGEGRTVALVSQDGTLGWWCPGRFDAPSVFASLLDARKGGHFRLGPAGEATSRSRYVPDTNVLETEHASATGKVIVRDFVPFTEDVGHQDSMVVRRVLAVEGTFELAVSYAPRFQYGSVMPRFSQAPHGVLARGGGEIMLLRVLRGPDLEACHDLLATGEGVREARIHLKEGDSMDFIVRHTPFDVPVPFAEATALAPDRLEEATVRRWRAWSNQTRFEGIDAPDVRRSALTLKLLQHAPTGAIVAAPTASLPEEIGGVRNWDYRFTWVRDAALTAIALMDCGHPEEAEAFGRWIAKRLDGAPDDLRIMYTVSGDAEIPEKELPHLDGHLGSAPVRIGNAAVLQRQLDVYGELIEFFHQAHKHGVDVVPWESVRGLADHVHKTWREPDQGIWEMRCPPRHFVYSKAMAWVALDRAAKMARAKNVDLARAAQWEAEAELVRADVLEKGYDPHVRAFTQAYGFTHLDASNLLMPLCGFIDANDPRMVDTVERTLEGLTMNGLVYRYIDAGDGLTGGEATFAYCTFWLIEVLAKQGRVRDARALFDRMMARANHLGLYAEEIDPLNGAHLGNFPQGFPHAGLIQAAAALRVAEQKAHGL